MTLSDASDVEAFGVDSQGNAVGYLYADSVGDDRAFYFSSSAGKMFDLNTLIDPNSGWILQDAYGINELGQITGDGLYNGVASAFLITPNAPAATPEPGSMALLVCMVTVGAGVLRKRRK